MSRIVLAFATLPLSLILSATASAQTVDEYYRDNIIDRALMLTETQAEAARERNESYASTLEDLANGLTTARSEVATESCGDPVDLLITQQDPEVTCGGSVVCTPTYVDVVHQADSGCALVSIQGETFNGRLDWWSIQVFDANSAFLGTVYTRKECKNSVVDQGFKYRFCSELTTWSAAPNSSILTD